MEAGDRVKMKFGGGHVGIITDVIQEYQVSYPMDGKPGMGRFRGCELELTDEEPKGSAPFGLRSNRED